MREVDDVLHPLDELAKSKQSKYLNFVMGMNPPNLSAENRWNPGTACWWVSVNIYNSQSAVRLVMRFSDPVYSLLCGREIP
jgi:hypothetical protein